MTCDRPARNLFVDGGRRQLLLGLCASLVASLVPRALGAKNADLEEDLRNLRLLDLTEGGRRFVLVIPKYQNPEQRLPLLVLLHGLGETSDARLGAYAWVEKYGLGSAWQRMKRAPVERTGKRGEWTDARLEEVNAELAARPFRGLALACPYMPMPEGPPFHDAYAKWVETSLLPRCRKEARTIEDREHTFLCGVSLGGYVSLEVLTRIPHVFGAWGGVQSAFAPGAAPAYADKILRDGKPRSLLVLTSREDRFRNVSEALDQAFTAKGVAHTFRSIPGPHDQPWLEEAGTLETLLWFDRLSYAS
jgi:predicted esterase